MSSSIFTIFRCKINLVSFIESQLYTLSEYLSTITQIDRQTHIPSQNIYQQSHRQTDRHTYPLKISINSHTDRQTDTHTLPEYRSTITQTNKQTDRHTDIPS